MRAPASGSSASATTVALSRPGADIFLVEPVEVDLLFAFDGRAVVRHARTHFILDSHDKTPSVAGVDGRNLQGRDGGDFA